MPNGSYECAQVVQVIPDGVFHDRDVHLLVAALARLAKKFTLMVYVDDIRTTGIAATTNCVVTHQELFRRCSKPAAAWTTARHQFRWSNPPELPKIVCKMGLVIVTAIQSQLGKPDFRRPRESPNGTMKPKDAREHFRRQADLPLELTGKVTFAPTDLLHEIADFGSAGSIG